MKRSLDSCFGTRRGDIGASPNLSDKRSRALFSAESPSHRVSQISTRRPDNSATSRTWTHVPSAHGTLIWRTVKVGTVFAAVDLHQCFNARRISGEPELPCSSRSAVAEACASRIARCTEQAVCLEPFVGKRTTTRKPCAVSAQGLRDFLRYSVLIMAPGPDCSALLPIAPAARNRGGTACAGNPPRSELAPATREVVAPDLPPINLPESGSSIDGHPLRP